MPPFMRPARRFASAGLTADAGSRTRSSPSAGCGVGRSPNANTFSARRCFSYHIAFIGDLIRFRIESNKPFCRPGFESIGDITRDARALTLASLAAATPVVSQIGKSMSWPTMHGSVERQIHNQCATFWLISSTRRATCRFVAWLFIVVISNLVKLGCHEVKVMPGDQWRFDCPFAQNSRAFGRRARALALAGRLRVDRSRSFNLLQACRESRSDDRTASRCPDRVGCSHCAARPLSDQLSNRVWSHTRRYQQAGSTVLRSIVR